MSTVDAPRIDELFPYTTRVGIITVREGEREAATCVACGALILAGYESMSSAHGEWAPATFVLHQAWHWKLAAALEGTG